MEYHPNIAAAAHLIADPARASILIALLDGKARPAGELAYAAGVTPQTASTHLAKLLDGGLLAVETEGRHRYYRLAGGHVAQVIETLATIGPADSVRRRAPSRDARHLQFARSCYDHLAGRLGVAVTQALQDRRVIVPAKEKQFELTPAGRDWLADLGLDTGRLRPTRRGLARQRDADGAVLDRRHLAGEGEGVAGEERDAQPEPDPVDPGARPGPVGEVAVQEAVGGVDADEDVLQPALLRLGGVVVHVLEVL